MTILDYGRLFWRGRVMIIAIVAVAIAAALIITSWQSKVYAARATILAPRESSGQGFSGALGALMGGGGREGGGGFMPAFISSGQSFSTNQDMFLAILKSAKTRNDVATRLAAKFGPGAASKVVYMDVTVPEKGVIAVSVESTDREISAEAANLYFEALDGILERLAEASARRQEKFYSDQLQRAAKEVAAAEEAVLTFSSTNRVPPIDAPTKTSVDANATLRASIMQLELQREVMRMKVTDQHPQMIEMDKQLAELKKQYSKNLFGSPMDLPGDAPGGRSRKEFFVSTEKMTPIQFAYLKLYRNLKIQEAFYTGALQGIEQIKYTGTQQVRVEPLDRAVPPGGHTRPRVQFSVVAAALAGLVLALVVVLMQEYLRQLRLEERSRRGREARRARNGHDTVVPDDALIEDGERFSAAGRAR